MTHQFPDPRLLANLAASLPPRARVGLALMGAFFALDYLKESADFLVAQQAFRLARRWYDSRAVYPEAIENTILNEHQDGILFCELRAKTKIEQIAWLALVTAVAYTAFHAYKARDEMPGPLITEVDEHALDLLNEYLDTLIPSAINAMTTAAEYLRADPSIQFDDLEKIASVARK